MPQIPRLEAPTVEPQVVDRPFARNVDVSSGTRQLGQAIGGLATVAQQIKKQKDEATAEDALLAFDDAKNEILFNPESGYFTTQGRAAVDSAGDTNKRLDTLIKQHLSNFQSPQARELFQRAVNTRVIRDKESILRHSAKGLEVWRLGNSKAEEENAVKNSTLFYNSDEDLRLYLGKGELAILDRKQYIGNEQVQIQLEDYRSSFARAAIDGALSRDDVTRAKELKKRYDKYIKGADLVKVNEDIQKKVDKLYIDEKVAEIYAPGKPLADMLKEARAEKDAEKAKEIERLIGNKFTLDEKALKETNEQFVNQYDQAISNGEMTYADVPADIKTAIGVAGRTALLSAEQEFVTGENVITDQVKLQNLISLPIKDLAKVVPYEHFSYLNKSDRALLKTAVSAAKKGVRTADLTRLQSNSTIAQNAVKQILGRKINEKSAADVNFANAFYGLVADEIYAQETTKDRKLEEVEVRAVVDKLVKNWVQERPWWFDRTLNLKDIPVDRLDALAAELRARGKAVTTENMIKLNQAAEKAGLFNE